jgi:hypothetical protein
MYVTDCEYNSAMGMRATVADTARRDCSLLATVFPRQRLSSLSLIYHLLYEQYSLIRVFDCNLQSCAASNPSSDTPWNSKQPTYSLNRLAWNAFCDKQDTLFFCCGYHIPVPYAHYLQLYFHLSSDVLVIPINHFSASNQNLMPTQP